MAYIIHLADDLVLSKDPLVSADAIAPLFVEHGMVATGRQETAVIVVVSYDRHLAQNPVVIL